MNSKHINMEGIGFILSGVFFFIIILWFWIYASESRCEGTYYTEEDNIGVTIDERICSSHSMGNLCGKMEKCKESLLSWKRMPVFMLIISFFIIYIGVNRRYGFEIDADALPFPAAMVLLPLLSYWSGEIGLLIFALVADIIIVIVFLLYLMVSYIKKRIK